MGNYKDAMKAYGRAIGIAEREYFRSCFISLDTERQYEDEIPQDTKNTFRAKFTKYQEKKFRNK